MNSELKPKIRFKGFTDDWEQRKFEQFALYRNGKAHENDISDNGKYVVVNSKFCSTNGSVRKYSDKQNEPLLKNEIAFVLSDVPNGRALARTFLVDKSNKYTLNQRIAGITPLENTDPYYLFVLMNRNKYFLQFDDGAKQTNLSVSDIYKFSEMFPNKTEQENIGSVFNNLDNLITLHQRKCDKLVELKKSLLEKMFPQNNSVIPEIRFKGFTDDWGQHKLSDNLKNIQTGTNLLGSIDNLGTPLLKMGNIQRGYFTTDKLEYLKDYSSIENENVANFGDFFFNTRNTLELVGKGATWFGISGKYAFNSNIARFTFEGINTTFFNYLYNTELLLKQVHSRAVGTTSVAAIYPQSLNTIEYMLPSYDEQSKIGDLLLNLDNLITLYQRKHDKLNKIKQSLLNDMFV